MNTMKKYSSLLMMMSCFAMTYAQQPEQAKFIDGTKQAVVVAYDQTTRSCCKPSCSNSCCKSGATGARGATGMTGAAGSTGSGATGATGATGALAGVYAYVYDTTTQPVINDAPVVFNTNGTISGGITNVAGAITVPNTGTYLISYSVTSTEGVIPSGANMIFAVAVNGSTFSSTEAGSTQTAGESREVVWTGLLSLAAGDVVSLHNRSGLPITIAPVVSTDPGSPSATFTIMQINP